MVQFKGIDAVEVDNHLRLFSTGNKDWIVPAGTDERRFTVLDVGEGNKQDRGFFGKLRTQMQNGGYEALMYDALHFDLSSVNLHKVFQTDALREQKIASLTAEEKWWLDTLMKGELPWGMDEVGCCPCDRLQARYQTHARRRGVKPRAIETELGMFLRKHAEGLQRQRKYYKAWDEKQKCVAQVLGPVYRFPSLEKCRLAFDEKMQQSYAWPEAGSDWTVEPRADADTAEI
jgi:hypothetical protein